MEIVFQFFSEQKQNFSGAEFNDVDDTGETTDEIEETLKSFDVKDCFLHVKGLINRIGELNEEIIQCLIQNTGTKQTKYVDRIREVFRQKEFLFQSDGRKVVNDKKKRRNSFSLILSEGRGNQLK